jgi:hypothetical protein
MAVTRRNPVEGIAQRARPGLVFITGVGSKIDVEARHLVEADDPVGRMFRQIDPDPGLNFA